MLILPEDFKTRMKAELGSEYESILAQYENDPYRGIRVNTLKLAPDELHSLFPYSLGNVEWCPTGFYYNVRAGREPASRAGLIYSQEPSAMIAAEELAPKKGDRVLDLCAAPGGKSTHIAALLGGEGLLVSNEIVPSRASILAENTERMGIKNAVVTNMSPEAMEKEFPCFFDKILVDAPCSGEGMFRRDAEAVHEWSTAHVEACAVRQINILSSALKMLRGGGELVYSTCTFSRAENEEVCERLLKEHTELSLVSMKRIMPHTHRGEGHFAAKFLKNGGGRCDRSPDKAMADSSLYREFEAEALRIRLGGVFAAFGERLFLVPEELGGINRLKLVRPGLYLGDNKKGRFEPSHALAMALKKEDFVRSAELGGEAVAQFYKGLAPEYDGEKGFTAALWNGFPIGWGKSVNGVLKNHIPKYLRG